MQEFKDEMQADGLNPPAHLPAGKIVTMPGQGKPKGNKAGRCLLFPDLQGGFYQDFSTGLFKVWQAKRATPYTEQERQVLKAQCERDRLAREQDTAQDQKATGLKACSMWKRGIYADAGNIYLHSKKIQPHGTKTGDSGGLKGVLIAPLYDESLKLVNLQFIQPDGTKRFLSGGKKKGCFWWIGKKSPTVLIAESFSTAASLNEHTGHQTFISYGEGNLVNVAKIVRAKNPDAEIIICGDNDSNGVGQKAAQAAALAIGGKYIIPNESGKDWNDILTSGGSI